MILSKYKAVSFLTFFSILIGFSQEKILTGTVFDEDNYPVNKAEITSGNQKVYSNSSGKFQIIIPENETRIVISAAEFNSFSKEISSSQKDIMVILKPNPSVLKEIIFQKKSKKSDLTSVEISPLKAVVGPSLTGGVEDILKSFPGVSNYNELSSQYTVRGGNYDENLVYINGIEVYRPQLVRSGQQEGLSIINPSMTSSINFSAGGFEAKYGDKMSSYLDIYYKRPKSFEAFIEASMLGGGITLGYGNKNQKFSAIVGARYRNTNLILNTLDENTDFNPVYGDIQTYLEYRFSPKLSLSFLGNIAQNDFENQPKSKETEFGTLAQPIKLSVNYRGHENDKFHTENGSITLRYKPTKNLDILASAFAFHTIEEEYFDIAGSYLLQEIDPDTGGAIGGFDGGGQINHARNDLDILVTGAQINSNYKFNVNSSLDFGLKYQTEDIRDAQNEWQLVDSTGYSIPRNEYIPGGSLDNTTLELSYYINSKVNLKTNRINGFIQYNRKFEWGSNKILLNAGIRATNWDYNNETNISPRIQLAIKPNWKYDMTFRFATGLYYQPPFYKEIRNLDGILNPNIKSQRSIHFVFGNDFEFKMLERDNPFKLTTELYYKKMDDLIPYFVDNVRVKYTAENNSIGHVYGIETRLNGEFVPGIESWFSLSYAKAEQNIDNKGWIPLPTDPRFKASLFFQDQMPFLPSMKASVNVIYASGLPNGAPFYADPYSYQTTLSSYKRADVGLSNTFIDEDKNKASEGIWRNFKELTLGLQIFNVFNIRNTISNQWIRDVNSSTSLAVPNRLTGRFFNLKLTMRF